MTAVITEVPQTVLNILTIPDKQFSGLESALDKDKIVSVRNKDNVFFNFYRDGDVIVGENTDTGAKHKVVSESEGLKLKEKQLTFKEQIEKRIRTDFPDISEEQLKQDADILYEANESIKTLIKAGLKPEVAKNIIFKVLESKDDITCAEDIARIMISEDIENQ